jgi:hypothetical protein
MIKEKTVEITYRNEEGNIIFTTKTGFLIFLWPVIHFVFQTYFYFERKRKNEIFVTQLIQKHMNQKNGINPFK